MWAIISCSFYNNGSESIAVLQCASAAAADMVRQNPGDLDRPNVRRKPIATRSHMV